eukprot:CAMPEP_0170064366 /NCGR_PEP_ID=MMETSP0019_2-20121128/4877_1 /TAXON_ID=98059 /ORGANISM="Dinobryon sp., Strain UTEXLB2267" /LENGTH=273 /DNA_ID=CAMNT_0010271011 /DNA_START=1538 /DNA_END=2359 /DNA_ORIENTATION=+
MQKAAVELGLYTFLGFAFQSIGLETTTASRSAFLLYLNVKFVPFLSAILYGRTIPWTTWLSALLAFLGTCLLSTDGGPLNSGDLWCILAAVSSALFILRLGEFSNRFDAAELNGVSFLTVFALCAMWVGGDVVSGHLAEYNPLDDLNGFHIGQVILKPIFTDPWPVLYLGGIATGICNYLQTIGQKTISAERAAIIYSLDPLYGAIFSRVFLGEVLGLQGYLGGLLILSAIWISYMSAKNEDKRSENASTDGSDVSNVINTVTTVVDCSSSDG